MSPLVACLLVLTVFGVSAYFARQQVQTLRGLPLLAEVSPEDRRYYHNQAWRRLFGCALLVAIGILIAAAYLSGLIDRIDAIGDIRQARVQDAGKPLDPAQTRDVEFFYYFVIAVLLMLMVLLFVAAWDVWAIRRYGARHYRRIQDDRRAMIERQLVQLRRERGHHRNGPSSN
jgi:hypothetical protein